MADVYRVPGAGPSEELVHLRERYAEALECMRHLSDGYRPGERYWEITGGRGPTTYCRGGVTDLTREILAEAGVRP